MIYPRLEEWLEMETFTVTVPIVTCPGGWPGYPRSVNSVRFVWKVTGSSENKTLPLASEVYVFGLHQIKERLCHEALKYRHDLRAIRELLKERQHCRRVAPGGDKTTGQNLASALRVSVQSAEQGDTNCSAWVSLAPIVLIEEGKLFR